MADCVMCVVGLSVMAHYGNPVIEWWNTAFTTLRQSGKFAELCSDATIKHGNMTLYFKWNICMLNL